MNTRAAEDPSPYAQTVAPAEERVVLHNVSWETYERLLEETGDDRRALQHEGSNRLIDRMIYIIADELAMDMRSAGQLTCKRQIAKKGLEPDSCYFIAHEHVVRGLDKINLDKNDPAPDLMVEIEITRSAVNKLAICAALGVAEVWRFDGNELRFFTLNDGQYAESPASMAFPKLPLRSKIPAIVARAAQAGEMQALREFRTWVKQQLEDRK